MAEWRDPGTVWLHMYDDEDNKHFMPEHGPNPTNLSYNASDTNLQLNKYIAYCGFLTKKNIFLLWENTTALQHFSILH
jgi:hypothetical protein